MASRRAVELAQKRYDRGLTDFLNVLDAERQLYDLQDQYAVAQADVVVQFIALYKGLGGGWESYQKIPPIRKPQPAIVATVREVISPDDPLKSDKRSQQKLQLRDKDEFRAAIADQHIRAVVIDRNSRR